MRVFNVNIIMGRALVATASLFFVSACATTPPFDENAVAQFAEPSQKTLAEINSCNVSWLNSSLSGSMLVSKNGYIYRHDETNTVLKLSDDGSVRTLRAYYRSGFNIRVFDTRDQFIAKARGCMK